MSSSKRIMKNDKEFCHKGNRCPPEQQREVYGILTAGNSSEIKFSFSFEEFQIYYLMFHEIIGSL
jgi:hypothetical protein